MMANNDYKSMLANFRTIDLKTLLGHFGQNITGRKSELNNRALELLRTRSPGFNHSEYLLKIHQIYQSQQTQQRQMMGQAQQQRMYQTAPQYQPPMYMAQGGLPQIMPQIQRDIYSNSVGANTIANNNIQYISGSYQPSRPRSIRPSHSSSSQQMNVASRDPLGYDMQRMTFVNSSYTPSPETVAQINFKKLPFYELIDVVIKPTILAGTDRCTLLNPPKGMKEWQFKLFLQSEAINTVLMNRDISPGKNDYPYQFQIRISQLVEPMSSEVTDFLPLGLHIRLGRKTCPLPPTAPNTRPATESRRSPRPINCTEQVKLSPITPNIITINWTDPNNYIMSMFFVKTLSSQLLIQRLQDKGGRSSEETKNYIIEKLADVDPDLATTSYRFSLVCPLGKIRMKLPAKSIHCDHLQCFDVSSFIQMNEKKPTWMCPTCNKPCLYDDIQIENYFLEVVSSPTLEDNSQEIEFLADGTWVVYEENKETNTTINSTTSKPMDSVVNLDSDEENVDNNIKVEFIAETVHRQDNETVDLTVSDNEEEPPKENNKQENEAQAADVIQPVAVVDLEPQAQVQPQQAVTSSEQLVVNEIDSTSPPSSPIPTTEAT